MASMHNSDESSALLGSSCRQRRRAVWAVAAIASMASLAVMAMAWAMLATSSVHRGERHRPPLASKSVGRYLHITDLHVDPLYAPGSTAYSQCHRRSPSTDNSSRSGYFGRPNSKCDSPVALINATADYLRREWRGVDFVAWTGDSGRHDGDAENPRTFAEIVEQNRAAARALRHAFGSLAVPNVGNNDVSPHNELPGPGHKRARRTFRALADAWQGLVPPDQLGAFHYGGYFARDLVDFPMGGGLTALSVNTMYWYRANAKVGGCRAHDSPGLAQLAWMRWQIRVARERGRDLIILGHVAPNKENYRPSCYKAYARTVAQVVPPPGPQRPPLIHAQLFGHSNVDAWAFVGPDADWAPANSTSDSRLWWEKQVDDEEGRFGSLIHGIWSNSSSSHSPDDDRDWADMEDDDEQLVAPAVPDDFVETLLHEYERVVMQTPRHPRLGITTISPSIIPKLLPAFRVFHYLHTPWRHLPAGTPLDYDVYTADLDKHNRKAPPPSSFFERLYRFSDVYAIDDLSVDSYVRWARHLLTSKSMRKRFRALTFLDNE
ncbi:Endopolyphosphatase [Coemansia sp. BCRC 34301]|nr:Endopolyphosphatase [Coemansia sp. BCRC 34301]